MKKIIIVWVGVFSQLSFGMDKEIQEQLMRSLDYTISCDKGMESQKGVGATCSALKIELSSESTITKLKCFDLSRHLLKTIATHDTYKTSYEKACEHSKNAKLEQKKSESGLNVDVWLEFRKVGAHIIADEVDKNSKIVMNRDPKKLPEFIEKHPTLDPTSSDALYLQAATVALFSLRQIQKDFEMSLADMSAKS